MKSSQYQMPSVFHDLLLTLHRSDEETLGHPHLSPEQLPNARELLSRSLTNADTGNAQRKLLEKLYHARVCLPLPRALTEGEPPAAEQPPQFRHRHLLPTEKTHAVVDRGPDVLSPDELASLLLNPYALYDLADLILWQLSGYWLETLEQEAEKLTEYCDIHIPIPGLDQPPPRASNS